MLNTEGLRDLLIFIMVNDEPSMYRTIAMEDYLNACARAAGYLDWIDAYHKL